MWQRIGRVAALLGIIALAIIFISTWLETMRDPEESKAADFLAFYTAGRVAQTHGYTATYDLDLQNEIANAVRGHAADQFLLYNHLPYFVPILALVTDDDYRASFTRWVLILLFIFLIAAVFLIRSLYAEIDPLTQALLGGGILTFLPLFISLWQGQDTAFLFLGLTLACVGLLQKNDWLAAAGFALVTVRPHICIALVLPLIFKHRHIFWKFVILAGLIGIYSLLLIHIQGVLGLLNLLAISAQGEWFGMNPQNMPNLTGLLYRTFHSLDHDAVNMLSWSTYFMGIILIALVWFRSKAVDEPLLGISILIAAMFAPHLHAHDLTVLILPVLFSLREQKGGFSIGGILILLAASFVLLSGLLVDELYFVVPYVVSAGVAWRLIAKTQAGKNVTPPEPSAQLL